MGALLNQGYFVLFVIVTLGIVVGNFKIKGFSLDLSAVIFVALLSGHLGYKVPLEFQTIGLLFFIFTIGIQSGPGFFDAFMKYGRNQIIVATVLVASGGLLTWLLAYAYDINNVLAVGIFNGALTSTPGLAAAIDATGSTEAAVGYGVAYPVGVVGVILFIQILPKLFRIDIKKSEIQYNDQIHQDFPELRSRHFVVENKNINDRSLKELELSNMTAAVISRIKHGDETFSPSVDSKLFVGDFIKVVGDEKALQRVELLVGPVTDQEIELSKEYKVNWVLVSNKQVVNKSIRELNIRAYDATVTRIRRSGIDLAPKPNTKLRFGDKLLVVGNVDNIKKVMQILGNEEKRLSETNFLPIALGIVLGVILGKVTIPFFGLFDFNLGITGGVLTAALVLSKIGKTGPIIWSMSGSANQLLRKLGLLLFMATVGTSAGENLVETIQYHGVTLIFVGAAITIIPMLIASIVGHVFFRMNFLTMLGVLAGSMTSTPGLAAIDSKSNCDASSVGYATVYPVALVLMIIISQVLSFM
ncbi:MAG: transporter [Bacteroidales bacterium]|nr:transporter [Bacteroidales bacterium]